MSGDFDPAAKAEAGFTLIETLVALACFASVFVAVQYGIAKAIRAARIADAEADALEVARSVLQTVGTAIPMKDMETGETKGLPWKIHVYKYDPQPPSDTPAKIQGYWVDVEVRWRAASTAERTLDLKTLKLSASP